MPVPAVDRTVIGRFADHVEEQVVVDARPSPHVVVGCIGCPWSVEHDAPAECDRACDEFGVGTNVLRVHPQLPEEAIGNRVAVRVFTIGGVAHLVGAHRQNTARSKPLERLSSTSVSGQSWTKAPRCQVIKPASVDRHVNRPFDGATATRRGAAQSAPEWVDSWGDMKDEAFLGGLRL